MKIIFHRATIIACMVMVFSACHSAAASASGTRLEIAGKSLYIAGIGHGFHVFDLANPVQPKWVGGWNNHTCPVGVQVVDNMAYVANRTSGFDVIDVNNPAAPARVGHLSTGGDLQTVQLSGHYAYVADERRGLDIIDVSNPRQPVLAGDFATKGQGWSAVVDGEYAYVSYGGGKLRAYHLTDGSDPKLIYECPKVGGNSLQVVDKTLFSGGFEHLYSLDIHDPADVAIITHSEARFLCQSLSVSGHLAVATGPGPGLYVFEVGETGNIRQLGFLAAGYQGFGVRIAGSYAYLVDGGSNLHVIDLNNPSAPVEVRRIGTENFCSPVISLTNTVAARSPDETQAIVAGAITNAPPMLADAVRVAGGAFSFTLHGVPNAVYNIQASTDLISWTVISTNTLAMDGTAKISDPDAHLYSNRFYRAVKQP